MQRHHTLPAGLPKNQNSSAPSRVGSMHSNLGRSDNENTLSTERGIGSNAPGVPVRTIAGGIIGPYDENSSKHLCEHATNVCTLTTSMTISSITSMTAAGSSPMRSPLGTEAPRSVFSPPHVPTLNVRCSIGPPTSRACLADSTPRNVKRNAAPGHSFTRSDPTIPSPTHVILPTAAFCYNQYPHPRFPPSLRNRFVPQTMLPPPQPSLDQSLEAFLPPRPISVHLYHHFLHRCPSVLILAKHPVFN